MGFCRIYKKSTLYSLFLFSAVIFLFNHGVYAQEFYVPSGNKFKIAIFKENGFPNSGIPVLLTPEWLYNSLNKRFPVTYLDFFQLTDRKYLNSGNFDLLILPYGEVFPYDAFASIKEYLSEGGGLLNVAGRPFWIAAKKDNNKWKKLDIPDPYKAFLSPLGIKYYESLDKPDIGLTVTTSLGITPIVPTHGNIFPYRIPVRKFYFLEQVNNGRNKYQPVIIKCWRNPYLEQSRDIPRKWCLIGQRGEGHILNPKNPSAKKNLLTIIDYLSCPVILYELETDLAAYYQKEKVNISVKILNFGKIKEEYVIDFKISDNKGEIVDEKSIPIQVDCGKTLILNEIWQPKEFKSDFYKVAAILKKGGSILDKEENGFVAINEKILKSGPLIQVEGRRFLINGKFSLLLGVNYYESELGELMWVKPNILKIKKDFESMRNLGINSTRIHYHHSKWFRDYYSQIIKQDIDPYLKVTDITALPSERSLRILDAIIQLAQKQGLIFCMDIFSLVPEEMGNPIGWLGLKERIINKKKIAVQKSFIELISRRYKNVPGVTWDLWNEPRLDKTDYPLLKEWSRQIKEVFRRNGDSHPITIGDDSSLYLLDTLDYASIHTYKPEKFTFLKDLSKPFIFQEVWDESGCSLNDEMGQAERLKSSFNAFLKTEAAGFFPWQWTRQSRLWDNIGDAERWDDELGVCVRDDGSLKPAGGIYSLLIKKHQ